MLRFLKIYTLKIITSINRRAWLTQIRLQIDSMHFNIFLKIANFSGSKFLFYFPT